MKKLLLIIIASTCLSAGEIVPIWKNFVPATVLDMELLPNGDEALLMVGKHETSQFIKISTDDGSIIDEYNDNFADNSSFEILPDSQRIIVVRNRQYFENRFQTKNINDLSELKSSKLNVPEGMISFVRNFVVDPIRPVIYACVTIADTSDGKSEIYGEIQIYNYETLEYTKSLPQYVGEKQATISISDDGKYLAAIDDGIESYLKIWDLESDELVINESLFAEGSQDENEAFDIYFSKNDRNIIYLSGLFSEKVHQNDKGGGLYKFELDSRNRTLLLPNEIYGAWDLHLIDDEERVVTTAPPGAIGIINLKSNELEWYNRPPDDVFTTNVVYNQMGDYFIGSNSGVSISRFKYDRQTNVNYNYENEIIISPNPTNNYITIVNECSEPIIDYSIHNVEGSLVLNSSIENSSNEFSIDFSEFSTGIYFLSFGCNNQIKTYKIVKEG